MAHELALAIDIGGTKMAAGLVDRSGALLVRTQAPTPSGADAAVLFDTLVGVVTALDAVGADHGISSADATICGVGCGGPMTRGGATVSPVNIVGWRAFPLRARLVEHLGLPVHVDNDAKALALGEGWVGAARGCSDYLAMVVSTGVGGGIVLDGRLLDGAAGNAGHIGHIVVEPDGHPCACGARGCLEAEASGTAIATITGRPAAEADPAMVRRTGTLVGRAVSVVANLCDLRTAVVAGSVALGFGQPFLEAANAELDARARLDFSSGARLGFAGLGDQGPLVGAAAVAFAGAGLPVLGGSTT
ncbi:MAG: ROK family protein [Acidimicrobiales bacterium]|nr:ROK family protein [Acidimicrobiales bacterium]